MNDSPEIRCLLVASIFPPLNGGSAVVYENLCRYAPPGGAVVLTPWRDYATGEVIEHWRETDAKASYPVERIELLRPLSVDAKTRLASLIDFLLHDIPLKFKIVRTAARLIRKHDINVICIGELNSGSWLGLVCRTLFGCKVINYIHGEEITTTTTYLLYGRNRKFYLRQADAIVAVSQFTRKALIDLMAVAPDKIRVIENGVDIEKFTPAAKDPSILARHGLENKKIILTVGRLVERKGIDQTLRALPEILTQVPDLHYLIVGTGEFRPKLEAIVEELKLHDHVTFAGRVSEADLVKYYQSCDLFVMPNRELADHDTEGFGLVFLEANACRKAVVGGRAGGAVEAVKHDETGLLVDGNRPEEIAGAIIELMTCDNKRLAMAKTGYQVALNASWAHKTRLFFDLCRDILR